MIDAHAHVHDGKFDEDRDAMVSRAFDVDDGGLEAIVNIGTSVAESEMAVDTAKEYSEKGFPMVATVGMHPHCFNGGREREYEWTKGLGADERLDVRMEALKATMESLEKLATQNPEAVKAIGEIGLDYFLPGEETVNIYQKKWQRTGFVVQVQLAKKLGLPVVVHGRPEDVATADAYHDIATVVADYSDVEFVMHCYQGNEEVTQKFMDLGNVQFSFTGTVTYSKSDDDMPSRVLKMIPVENMMIETDCPYLSPVPMRGKRNEPAFVKHVAAYIADMKDISVEKFSEQVTMNTKGFFHI